MLKGAGWQPSIGGTILPGRADSQLMAIQGDPEAMDDVVLSITVDFDHGAVFVGDLTAKAR